MENLTILTAFPGLLKEAISLFRKSIYRIFGVVTVGFAAMYLNFVAFLSVYRLFPVVATALTFIFALFIYQIFRLALVRSLAEDKGVAESYKFSLKKFKSYLSANFFSFLSVIGGLPVIIPGISFYHSYFLIPFIIASGDKNGVEASLRSREYISGYWWESLGRRLSILLLVILAYILISLPSEVLGPVWAALANLALVYLAYPIIVAFDLSLFRNIAEKRPSLRGDPIRSGTASIPYILTGIGAALITLSLIYVSLSSSGIAAITSVLIYLSVIFTLFIF